MRIIPAAIFLVFCTSVGMAPSVSMAQSQSEKPAAATDSMGRPLKPDAKGKSDMTAPTTTGGGGAPASSPQGQTPPGNQAAPDGSSQSVKPKE
jgi:hypothetical protein